MGMIEKLTKKKRKSEKKKGIPLDERSSRLAFDCSSISLFGQCCRSLHHLKAQLQVAKSHRSFLGRDYQIRRSDFEMLRSCLHSGVVWQTNVPSLYPAKMSLCFVEIVFTSMIFCRMRDRLKSTSEWSG